MTDQLALPTTTPTGNVTLHAGDCLDILRTLPDCSIDAVVTDPPYGLEFMGKAWDSPWKTSSVGRGARVAEERANEMTPRGKGHATSGGPYLAARVDSIRVAGAPFQQWCESWATECLRVLKPGGHMLAFGGSRTWHRLASAVEDAGFEVRDSIAWLYGSGFPKSLNLPDGRGTALKPAFEPIVVGRKPLAGTVAQNVTEHGTGALNIDGCRIGDQPPGRWPANVVLDDAAAAELDQQSGSTTSARGGTIRRSALGLMNDDGWAPQDTVRSGYGDQGGASRFFYTAKAGAGERPEVDGVRHPTVKPLSLMRWLVRLVTPPGGIVLDPFAGSGTTAEACMLEHLRCIAIEREASYLPLIQARLERHGFSALTGDANG